MVVLDSVTATCSLDGPVLPEVTPPAGLVDIIRKYLETAMGYVIGSGRQGLF